MSDQFEGGTVEGQPDVQTDAPETPAPSYLTREEAEQLMKQAVDEALNRQVGLYSKGTEKLRTRLAALEEHVELQRSSGITVNDADVERMRNKILTTSLTEQDDKPQVAPAAAQQPAVQGLDPQRINTLGRTILENMGVTFTQGDPEIKAIKTNGTPEEYLESLTKAASAWKKRTSESANPETRIPGLVGSGIAGNREAAINQELEKLYRSPRKDMARINELIKELQSIVRK